MVRLEHRTASEYVMNFDGSCGPVNPGKSAGWGYTIKKDGVFFVENCGYLSGQMFSNNYAEFYAFYKGVEHLLPLMVQSDKLFVRGDSQIVINIMAGKWRGKADKIYWPAYELAKKELTRIRSKNIRVSLDWVPREMNKEADALSTCYVSK